MLNRVRDDWRALISTKSKKWKGDREIVMEAVKQNGRAVQYASAELKGDRGVAMHAVAQSSTALWLVSPALYQGGLRSHVAHLTGHVFNVPKHTFIATILFGAKASLPSPRNESAEEEEEEGGASHSSSCLRLCDSSGCFLSLLRPSTLLPAPLSTQIKRLIGSYAGVRSGAEWRTIEAAARNLGVL